MEYRYVGKWGLRVSEVSLGSWMTLGSSVSEAESIKLAHHAFDKGIVFFDTADVYSNGEAERVLGKFLREVNRDSIVIGTKAYWPTGPGPNDQGLGRKHLVQQCHASLRNLGIDCIDLYQCHRHDPATPMEELVRTMDDLTRQGKILYWGVSEWSADQIREAAETATRMNAAPPISSQPMYNMLHRDPEREVFPASRKVGMGQIVFSPLAQGALTGKYRPGQPAPTGSRAADKERNMWLLPLLTDANFARMEQLSALAHDLNLTTAQLALGWCLRTADVASVIIGATKIEQIDDNIGASGGTLDAAILDKIESILNA